MVPLRCQVKRFLLFRSPNRRVRLLTTEIVEETPISEDARVEKRWTRRYSRSRTSGSSEETAYARASVQGPMGRIPCGERHLAGGEGLHERGGQTDA